MDIKHLRTFVEVARQRNLTRAAETLHLTQPAISLQLKHLQASTGLALFTRTVRGLVLTADGRAMLTAAERVLGAFDDFDALGDSLQNTVRGSLRIGTVLNPEFLRLGTCLRQLLERYPHLQTSLRHGMSGWVAAQVQRGELDMGFFLGPLPATTTGRRKVGGGSADLDSAEAGSVKGTDLLHTDPAQGSTPSRKQALHLQALAPFTYYVIAPQDWSARIEGQGWAQIAALPWIGTPPDSAHHRLLSKKFAALGVTPRVVAEVDQEASMLDLVRAGVGLSLARDSIALRESQTAGLQIVKGLSIRTELALICLESRRTDPVIQAAFSVIGQAFR
ncbi:LysR family transcriptional regulator [Pigmentiphaga aceris]|uniref:LysR family transcriptional regulator n=1 Tax=Pigmentiphaga aceris TaxID=1940612 RepID=A0A5C0B027_9BURK|nr:LysR family transcriptional regulator [Pigmentiphaga aceris]QEI08072.1 LysR family transcriptional regulator [Pigmentiphaga aceris]